MARRMEDLMDYQSPSLFPDARFPPKFNMPVLDKFDGTGCPKSYLKMYMRAMQPLGATEEQLAQMFQNTLTGAVLRWFLNLDDARARSWEDICHEFHNQYKYNIEVDMTRRDLETTKQEPKESFSTFIIKWRAKTAQMMNRPSEEEQIQMVVKNLLPIYHYHLFAQYFPNFKALLIVGTQVEDAINNGIIKGEDLVSKKITTPERKVNAINPQRSSIAKPQRNFSELYMTLSEALEKLQAKGVLKPLDSKPIPNPMPRSYNPNAHCKYRQGGGHTIDKCFHLRHDIQELIDQQVITPPSSTSHPDFV